MVDYLDQLQDLAAGDFTVQWTFGSWASKLVHPSSAYTASVQDVQDGLIDMAVGPIWVGTRTSCHCGRSECLLSPSSWLVAMSFIFDSLRSRASA